MARPVDLAKGSRFVILAAICVVVAALYFAQEVFIPLALAMLLTFVLAPLVARLERLRLRRAPSVLIVVLLSLGMVGGLGYLVTSELLKLVENSEIYKANIKRKVDAFRGKGGVVEKLTESVDKARAVMEEVSKAPDTQPATQPATVPAVALPSVHPWQAAAERRAPAPADLPGASPERPLYTRITQEKVTPFEAVWERLGVALNPAATAGLVIVFVLFMLLNREDLRDRIIRLVGQGQLHTTTQALDDAGKRISRYLLAQTIVNITYGIAVVIGLFLIGLTLGRDAHGKVLHFPNVLLWALLCAVLRFIPYLGPWLGAAFPIALSFAVYESYTPFIATLCMFVVIELWSNNIMEPWLYGASTGISTVAILAAAVFWTWLWGPIGLLLSTPLTVVLVVIGKYVPQLRFLDIMLGDEPVLEPPERIYQRLLSSDAEEAAELAEEYRKERGLARTYDEVLLPALALAEQDRHRGRLDADRQEFVRQAMRDMVEELADADRAARADAEKKELAATATASRTAADKPIQSGNGKSASGKSGNGKVPAKPSAAKPPTAAPAAEDPGRYRIPNGCKVNVVLLPANDEADEVVGMMLAKLLEDTGICAFPVSQSALASEMVEHVETHAAHVVVVSALPPSAVSHARYLCKRLHARWPDLRMVVGLWTTRSDLDRAKERLTCADSVRITTALQDAREQVWQLVQPVLVENTAQ